MFRRLLIIAASAVIFGGALVSCGDSGAGAGGDLEWRSAVDVPLNIPLPVNFGQLVPGCKNLDADILTALGIDCRNLTTEQDSIVDLLIDEYVARLPEDTCFILNLGADTVKTDSDVMDFLRKLSRSEIRYSVGVNKRSDVKFTVYGMFFPTNDSLANVKDSVFYDIIRNNRTTGKRVNVLDSNGLTIIGGDRICYPSDCSTLTDTNSILDSLVIGRGTSKKFSYRWLVMLEKSEYENLRHASVTMDTVRIRIRLRFSGVNSMDSLFTL